MRRLYIGGLSHSVTQNDLKERFGRFGVVEDVEVRTRMDDEGVPYKTFSYININISDGDLKKCMTLLNKSKWKGGTLQIETAKESFLQRLAEERQTAAEQQGLRQPEAEDQKQKVLDSLSKAGVENFTMKAAVPGTEVPGHKDWVVSKFGRVLPVLQLRAQKGSRARTLKYDPSKYSHNIRKLDRAAGADPPAPLTPVTQLTWEVRGGDDDISKKRRGEFPPFEPPRRKKVRAAVNARSAEAGARSTATADSAPRAEAPHLANEREPATDPGPPRRTWPRFAGGADSDDEIRRLVAAQDTSHGALRQEEDDEGDKLEVVGLDYLVCKAGPEDKDENDYDSADTDELFASRKAAPPPPPQERPAPRAAAGNQGDRKRTATMKKKKKSQSQDEEDDSSEEEVFSRKPPAGRSSQKQSKKMKVLPDVNPPSSESDEVDQEEEVEVEEEGPSDCSSDSDYEAMFSNVTRLEISLADLQKLAEESEQTSETAASSVLAPAHKKGTLPEEILAFLMKDSKEDRRQQQNEEKKKKNKPAPLPAFKGTRAPSGGSDTEDKEGGGGVKKQKLEDEAPQTSHKATGSKINGRDLAESESSEEEEEEEEAAACGGVKNMAEAGSSSSSEEEEKRRKKPLPAQPKAAAASSSRSSSSSEEEQENAVKAAKPPPAPNSESSSEEEEEEEEEHAPPPRLPLGAKENEERQRKANERRLAAVQKRQKEAEEHKQLIQGALSSLDAPKAAAGKHIVFGSGDEDERQTTSEDEATGDKAVGDKETAKGKVRPKPSVPQLFAGSEDDEEGDDEEDGSRFDIKPQFEGHVGQKLMELQSRFGRDERFRMDSRFLDEEEEEESEKMKSGTEEEEALDEERKKNLSILQSVLGGSQTAGAAKAAAKAKTFRDVSALHYDPSREEHAAFETKTDDTKKDSKSARRKKREEAQKLPEVSKEIYYDVSGDLKAVFGQAKADEDVVPVAEDKETNWDREEEEEAEEEEGGGGNDEEPTLQPSLLAADPAAESEEASGFKFSFFEDDTQTGGGETEYKVESIQAAKVSWQQDLRFPDSSSDDDEEEQQQPGEEEEEQQDATAKTTEVEIPSKTQLFFFYSEDSRLAEGPRSFCRPSHLEEQREQWEERRTELRQEYRKKHKDARRKLRSSMKS
ncbi:nucleolar protein 8 isoform X2 [Pungitius pungitius]|uniref:nucleolar protein 8 isoform X2 n=1 Tax=Pungitius pungitius TaxID=134920 RepID=UPI002E10C81F